MPIVNPGGMLAHKRANPNGVDLMRNAPQRAESRAPFRAGGQTLSPLLPWYCGRPGTPMEAESTALLKAVSEQLASRPSVWRLTAIRVTGLMTASGFRMPRHGA